MKTLCREISELDTKAPVDETRIKIIIIHGLTRIQKLCCCSTWQNQPSLVEFENLLAGQEALDKQMGEVSLKGEVEALYIHNGRWKPKQHINDRTKRNEDKAKNNQGEKSTSEARNYGVKRKFEGKCYNYGKKGHMAKDYWLKKEPVEGNVATFKHTDEWDPHAFFTIIEETTFTKTTSEHIDYEKDGIINSGCSNHITGDKEKLQNLREYKGKYVVVITKKFKATHSSY